MSMKTLAARLQYAGGNQLGRINKQKLNSLKLAMKNDYNTRFISTPTRGVWRCLINTNNLKSDYDKEYVSVEFESGLEAGDVFETLDNGMHWMVYLPIITETAYLRSEIIRCRYTLEVHGEEYWIYVQGPTETDLRWFQKNQIETRRARVGSAGHGSHKRSRDSRVGDAGILRQHHRRASRDKVQPVRVHRPVSRDMGRDGREAGYDGWVQHR